MQQFAIICFLATLLGCSNSQTNTDKAETSDTTTSPAKPLQIDNSEDGWGADIRLSIVAKFENDTVNIYKAVSIYDEQKVGLLISVPKRKEGDKGFGHGILLKSVGIQSDYLLRTLSQLYNQPSYKTATFINEVSVNYVNLKAFAKAVTGQEGQSTVTNQYKLFFEGKSDEEYAELFLNINLMDNWIELLEKDEEYRPKVLSFLSK
jgi:hypothetical protein